MEFSLFEKLEEGGGELAKIKGQIEIDVTGGSWAFYQVRRVIADESVDGESVFRLMHF